MHERHAVKPGIVPVDRRDLFKGLRDLLAPYGLTPEKKLSREKPMAMPKMPLRAGYKHWCADKALKSLRNLVRANITSRDLVRGRKLGNSAASNGRARRNSRFNQVGTS